MLTTLLLGLLAGLGGGSVGGYVAGRLHLKSNQLKIKDPKVAKVLGNDPAGLADKANAATEALSALIDHKVEEAVQVRK